MSLLIVQILHGVVFRWFDSSRDDGLIERELNVVHYVQSPPPQESTEEDERGHFLADRTATQYDRLLA